MFVRKFLAWAAAAPPADRAPAAASLARALLEGELPKDEEYEAEVALAVLADDPSPLVRRAIAEEIASRANAPRQIVVALAGDQSEIAAPLLRWSPALADADLIDAAIVGDAAAQAAIAQRQTVSASVCAALVEIGCRDAVVALLDNRGASVPLSALDRAVERFDTDAPVREALLARADLKPALRARLVDVTASALQDFVLARGWMPAERVQRAIREAREKSYVILAGEAEGESAAAVTKRLRDSGRLTAALLLRSLLSGERRLLESALAVLAGVDRDRAAGLVVNAGGSGFAALYVRAKLPGPLLPVFRFALAAIAEGAGSDEFADGGLHRALVERVLARCEGIDLSDAQPVLGLLRRFHAEAARQEARGFAAWLVRAEAMAADGSRATLEPPNFGLTVMPQTLTEPFVSGPPQSDVSAGLSIAA